MAKILSFDIGGTGCQWIKFNGETIEKRDEFSTKGKNKQEVLRTIASIINLEADENTKVGISSPTAVNLQTGYAYGLSGIEGYGNFNLYEELGKLIDNKEIEIKATNDANAALLGSLYFEKEDIKDAILVSLGTGVGGAICLNGNIITGKNGFAGEFGYGMMMDKKLNVSQNLSTIALTRMVKEKTNEDLSGKQIWDKFTNGELKDVVEEWIDKNARFFAFISYSFNPEVIFVGGGISANKDFMARLTNQIEKELKDYGVEKIMPQIKPAKGGGDAGIYGAMSLWKERSK